MINRLMMKTYMYFNKIKLLHSIPGRIRLLVPGLNMIPKEMKNYENKLTELIKLLNGIECVEYSYITNKILIKYDASKLNEKIIMAWLNTIFKTGMSYEKKLKDKPVNEIEKEFDLIYEELKNRLNKIVPNTGGLKK